MPQHTGVLVLGGILGLLAPMHAHAQGAGAPGYRVEVFGEVGPGNFENGVSKGQSARHVGGGLGWRPSAGSGRLGVEFRVAHMTHGRIPTVQTDHDQLNAWLVGGAAAWHFGSDTRAQGFVLGGLGVIKASASRLCLTCEWNVDAAGNRIYKMSGESEQGTDPAFMVGTGFKAAVAPHVAIRGELLLAHALGASYQGQSLNGIPTSKGPWGWTSLTIGAALRF